MELNGGNVCFAASAAAAGRAAESDVTDYGAYKRLAGSWFLIGSHSCRPGVAVSSSESLLSPSL